MRMLDTVAPSILRRARVATSILFAVHGVVMASFAARLPWVADHVGVGEGGLGVALLMPGFGAIVAMPLSARLTHRYDLRSLTRVLIVLWCAALLMPGWPTSLPVLCAVLLVYGASAGLADVAMNAHAVVVEDRYGRSIMSGFHGWWSIGGLVGAGLAAIAARTDMDARIHFTTVSVGLTGVALLASRWLIPHRQEETADAPPAFALPTKEALPIGLVGLCAVFAEGAGVDWSAVFVRDVLDHPMSTAAATVAEFSVSMAAARFAGDAVVRRFGPVATVRVAALLATAGALAVLLSTRIAVVVAGLALGGIGIAVVVPLAFAAAGRVGDNPGRSLAAVAGIAYGAGLIAPGVIGGIAHLSSLTVSFIVVVIVTALMGLGARTLRPASAK
ncbi:MFS transporter [Virgisporangium ochraceum]